jgi:hypothetical protein
VSRRCTSFVIRVWLEERARPTAPEWRWHILHVQSGRRRYVRSVHDLLAFIALHSKQDPPAITT